jgi:hypothetical protein
VDDAYTVFLRHLDPQIEAFVNDMIEFDVVDEDLLLMLQREVVTARLRVRQIELDSMEYRRAYEEYERVHDRTEFAELYPTTAT